MPRSKTPKTKEELTVFFGDNKTRFLAGTPKHYIGQIPFDPETNQPNYTADTFGYYLNQKGKWVAFITDHDLHGVPEIITHACATEEKALSQLYQFYKICH